MNQWISEATNQRFNGSVSQWVNASMNQWINESMTEWIYEMTWSQSESETESEIDMNDWRNERMNEWVNEWLKSTNQWSLPNSSSKSALAMWVFMVYVWNRALATVSCTFCRPHLPKGLRDSSYDFDVKSRSHYRLVHRLPASSSKSALTLTFFAIF